MAIHYQGGSNFPVHNCVLLNLTSQGVQQFLNIFFFFATFSVCKAFKGAGGSLIEPPESVKTARYLCTDNSLSVQAAWWWVKDVAHVALHPVGHASPGPWSCCSQPHSVFVHTCFFSFFFKENYKLLTSLTPMRLFIWNVQTADHGCHVNAGEPQLVYTKKNVFLETWQIKSICSGGFAYPG